MSQSELEATHRAPSFSLLIFGASGDLTITAHNMLAVWGRAWSVDCFKSGGKTSATAGR
ncbi:MAG TPA: hypothetical protein G4O05_06510 [Caldilineae bacterium]|nr:hypothetical protein [Caldilineae bacterium]